MKAINLTKKYYGNDHNLLSTAFGNLGDVYMEQKKFKQALEVYQKAVEMTRKMSGNDSPLLIKDLERLSNIYKELKMY